MAYQRHVFSTPINTGDQTSTPYVDLMTYKHVSVIIPTFAAGLNTAACRVDFMGSGDGTTFYPLMTLASATVATLTTTNDSVIVALGPECQSFPRYFQVKTSGTNSTATAGLGIKIAVANM